MSASKTTKYFVPFVCILILTNCKKDKLQPLPQVTTTQLSNIWNTTATCGGTVVSDGGNSVTARGVCWSINASPTVNDSKTSDGAGGGDFVSSISGLTPSTSYFVRAYATSAAGTAYGLSLAFETTTGLAVEGAGVIDVQGNSYKTVVIDTMEWMAENLKTSQFANGVAIPNPTDASWWTTGSGAWCYFNNDISFNNPYGKLYNWFAVSDSRSLCPTGWRMPNNSDWTTLELLLGGSSVAGGAMKETGTVHWASPNTGATNSSLFTDLPGGDRRGSSIMVFEAIDSLGRHWSMSSVDNNTAYGEDISYEGTNVGQSQFDKHYGFSVRCVKNQ